MDDTQQGETTAPAVQATATRACPHPEAAGKRWGDQISEARQAKLQAYLDRWESEADHGKRRGPFDAAELSGADVGWIAERVKKSGTEPNLLREGATLHLEGANLYKAHLEGFYFPYTKHMEDAKLREAHLEGASLTGAYLEHANFMNAHLENAYLNMARLEGAILTRAFLENALLNEAHLEGAILAGAHLEGTILHSAHLEGAGLSGASGNDAVEWSHLRWPL